MDLQDLYNLVDFLSKRGDQPGTAPQVTALRDIMKDTGKVVDDYVLGGTYQANMRGQDALLRQLALNAVAGGVGAGLGYGASKAGVKLAPKVGALMEWIKPRDIGVHLSMIDDLDKIKYGINTNLGARATEKFPVVPDMTYKLSSVDINGKKMPAEFLTSSAEEYSGAFWPYDEENYINAYVTKSKLGEIDPEILSKVGKKYIYNNQSYYKNDPVAEYGLNSRMTPEQTVVNKVKVNAPFENEGMFTEKQTKELEKIIKSERVKELLRSMLRGSAVGSAVVAPAGVIAKRK